MAITITINGTITEDESGINDSPADNNVTALPSGVSTDLNSAITTDGVVTPTVNATYFPTFAEKDGAVSFTGSTGTVNVKFTDASGARWVRTARGRHKD